MAFRRRRFGRRSSRRRYIRRGYGRRSMRGTGYSSTGPAQRYLQPRTSYNFPRVQTTHFWQTAPVGIFCNSTTINPNVGFPYFVSGAVLNGVPTANGITGRIGNRILMQSLLLTGHVRYQPFTTSGGGASYRGDLFSPAEPSMHCVLFLVYFSGRQPPDTSMLPHPYTDFLQNQSATNPQPRLDPPHPYRVIWRKRYRFDLSPLSGGTEDDPEYALSRGTLFEVNKKIRLNLPTVFADAPAPEPTWDTIRQGQLQLMCFYPNPSNSRLPVFDLQARLAFVEY